MAQERRTRSVDVTAQVIVEGDHNRDALAPPAQADRVEELRAANDAEAPLEESELRVQEPYSVGRNELAARIAGARRHAVVEDAEAQ